LYTHRPAKINDEVLLSKEFYWVAGSRVDGTIVVSLMEQNGIGNLEFGVSLIFIYHSQ